MCAIQQFLTKAQNTVSTYITTENVLVSMVAIYQKNYNFFFTTIFFISNTFLNNLFQKFCF